MSYGMQAACAMTRFDLKKLQINYLSRISNLMFVTGMIAELDLHRSAVRLSLQFSTAGINNNALAITKLAVGGSCACPKYSKTWYSIVGPTYSHLWCIESFIISNACMHARRLIAYLSRSVRAWKSALFAYTLFKGSEIIWIVVYGHGSDQD